MKFVVLALGLVFSTLATKSVLAQSVDPVSPYYGGLALGLFTIYDSSTTTAVTLISGLGGSANVNQTTSSSAVRAFGGVHLDQTLSLELGYFQTASVTQNISAVAGNGSVYTGTATLRFGGWDYSILIRPHRALSHKGPFLRLGGHYLTVGGNVDLTATNTIANTSSYSGSGFFWGAGYDVPIKESLDLRLEYLAYKNIAGRDGTTDNYCVAVVKHF